MGPELHQNMPDNFWLNRSLNSDLFLKQLQAVFYFLKIKYYLEVVDFFICYILIIYTHSFTILILLDRVISSYGKITAAFFWKKMQ